MVIIGLANFAIKAWAFMQAFDNIMAYFEDEGFKYADICHQLHVYWWSAFILFSVFFRSIHNLFHLFGVNTQSVVGIMFLSNIRQNKYNLGAIDRTQQIIDKEYFL